MLPRRLAQEHGRLALLALILGFALYFAVAGPPARLALWRTSGFPTMIPTFGDARVITSGWECARLGYDVLQDNPCDPFGRAMNYPRIWTVPALIADVGQGWTGRLAAGRRGMRPSPRTGSTSWSRRRPPSVASPQSSGITSRRCGPWDAALIRTR